jgi:hypothetical protein
MAHWPFFIGAIYVLVVILWKNAGTNLPAGAKWRWCLVFIDVVSLVFLS